MAKYRIEFTIQQYDAEGDDWVEIGFGSSGSWEHVDSAMYAVQSTVQNREWETQHWQPAPESIPAL